MYEYLKKLFKEVDGQPEAITAEELIKRIQADKNLNIVNLKEGGYVSKDKFDAKETELTGIKTQLADANKEIQSYKDMDIEGIKKSAQDLFRGIPNQNPGQPVLKMPHVLENGQMGR